MAASCLAHSHHLPHLTTWLHHLTSDCALACHSASAGTARVAVSRLNYSHRLPPILIHLVAPIYHLDGISLRGRSEGPPVAPPPMLDGPLDLGAALRAIWQVCSGWCMGTWCTVSTVSAAGCASCMHGHEVLRQLGECASCALWPQLAGGQA